MKIFNLILLINILRPCVIAIIDEKHDSCVCGYVQVLKRPSYHENKNVFFSDKDHKVIESTSGGCLNLCTDPKHRILVGHLKMFRAIQENTYMYCVCVKDNDGAHAFDLVIIKYVDKTKSKMHTFIGNKCCISDRGVIPEARHCCECDGSGFIKMMAEYAK